MRTDTTEEQTTDEAVPVYNRTNGNNNWATPRPFLLRTLDALGLPPVGLDIAAERATALAPLYFAPDHPEASRRNALGRRARWEIPAEFRIPGLSRGTRYLNPPYGRLCLDCKDKVWKGKKYAEDHGLAKDKWCERRKHTSSTVVDWVKRAAEEGLRGHDPLVLLVPARTDTEWWHQYVHGVASRVFFIDGRLSFLDPTLKATDPAPFPSVVIEYMPRPGIGAWITQFGTLTTEGRVVQQAERRYVCGTCRGESCHV